MKALPIIFAVAILCLFSGCTIRGVPITKKPLDSSVYRNFSQPKLKMPYILDVKCSNKLQHNPWHFRFAARGCADVVKEALDRVMGPRVVDEHLAVARLLVSVDWGFFEGYLEWESKVKVSVWNKERNLIFSQSGMGSFLQPDYHDGSQDSKYNIVFNSVASGMDSVLGDLRRDPAVLAIAETESTTFAASSPIPSLSTEPLFAGHIGRDEKTREVGERWALVVGVSDYKYSGQSGLVNLIFADDDAKAFSDVLHRLGWSGSHIKLLINEEATQRNIVIALESWLTKAGPNDQIVLFWAGHGFSDPEDPEKVYFACYDTDMSIPATGYRMDKVRSALEERRSKNVILLADTCHAGKLITRGDRGISIVPQIDKMRREKNIPKGWIFMVGADTDRQAIEHTSWTNGAFTHSLIKGLNGEADGFQSAGKKDGIVTMGELKDYMKTSMPDETQKVLGVAKHPVITTSTGDPDIWNLTLQAK